MGIFVLLRFWLQFFFLSELSVSKTSSRIESGFRKKPSESVLRNIPCNLIILKSLLLIFYKNSCARRLIRTWGNNMYEKFVKKHLEKILFLYCQKKTLFLVKYKNLCLADVSDWCYFWRVFERKGHISKLVCISVVNWFFVYISWHYLCIFGVFVYIRFLSNSKLIWSNLHCYIYRYMFKNIINFYSGAFFWRNRKISSIF